MLIKLIYNPVSGDGTFKNKLDKIINIFQEKGYKIIPYRMRGNDDFLELFTNLDEKKYHGIVVAGGDGSVNEVINGIKKSGINIPLGIMPWGTVNDFAFYLGMTKNIEHCCNVICNGKTRKIDIGIVNNECFINVIGAGYFAEVAHKTRTDLKNIMGKLAYYLKGIEGIPNLKPIKIDVLGTNISWNGEAYLLLILNTPSAGGFSNMAPKASIDDGKLDIIILKSCNIAELIPLILKILKNEHLNDPNIISLQADKLIVNCKEAIETDVDGEKGPSMPLDISVSRNSLKVFTE